MARLLSGWLVNITQAKAVGVVLVSLAYHFLKEDMTSSEGHEPPWQTGEERTIEGKITICERGYHSSPNWYDALRYAPGTVACIVEVSNPVAKDRDKQVSHTRKLVAAVNVERELQVYACDCAEKALKRERKAGRAWTGGTPSPSHTPRGALV